MKETKENIPENSAPNEYLSKEFIEELNFKLWSTKGARFNCDKRLSSKASMSNISLAFISAYLIIASLITVFGINVGVSQSILNFIITGLSILVLVFSQFENAQNYSLNAKTHHDSGLRIAELYNELRIFKTLKKKPSDFEIYSFAKDITKRYENVLSTSGNHSTLDYKRFLMSNIEYMKKDNPNKVKHLNKDKIRMLYYWNVCGWYFLLIITPPILLFLILST